MLWKIVTTSVLLLGRVLNPAIIDPDVIEIEHNHVNEVVTQSGSKSGITIEEHEIIFKYYNSDYRLGERIFINNVSEQTAKGWRNNTPLKVATHGWLSSEKSGAVDGIKNAYIEKTNYNVITVDWSETASWKAYPLPAYMTWQVGGIVARLIDRMVEKQLVELDNVHVIGHSLGSHVSGATGAQVKSGRVARITGLDPAGPGFELINYVTHNSLDVKDAKFVDIIHTASGIEGYYSTLGHADFYPNGGTPMQPGCTELKTVDGILAALRCSHSRAWEYYRDSILYPHSFKAHRCENWKEFTTRMCEQHETVYMGDETRNTARGVYYLRTSAASPFGLENHDDQNEIVT